MNTATIQQLLELNRQFYQTFGADFSVTRQRIQPGVKRVLGMIEAGERILDLGCGNGELARTLTRRDYSGLYVGLDFSRPMLEDARRRGGGNTIHFIQADLAYPEWQKQVVDSSPFSTALAFAVMHHLPGTALRLETLRKIHSLLKPDGYFIHSEWQFLSSPRLRARVQPWEQIGLSSRDIDRDDYLLDWRRGGRGLRYVHHFSEDELRDLASASGFQILETFYSDGEGNRLSLYQTWAKL